MGPGRHDDAVASAAPAWEKGSDCYNQFPLGALTPNPAMKDITLPSDGPRAAGEPADTAAANAASVLVSVIIPARDSSQALRLCLDSIAASSYPNLETIVVSDASTDDTAEVARQRGVRVITNNEQCGAAYARNVGARAAAGDILFFADADVVLNPDAISRAADCLLSDRADAVFGSYTAETRLPQFTARFKNYQHHFHHQQGSEHPVSFWSGCGAVTREAFTALEGFDVSLRFCEDIEFGHALVNAGYRVRLLKQMQAEHLKSYGLRRLIRSELLGRAIPWTRLLRSGRSRMGTLNTNANGVLSVALTGLALSFGALSLLNPWMGWLALGALLSLAALNAGFLRFLVRRRGVVFMLASMPLLFLHYAICGVGYIAGHLTPRYAAERTPAPNYLFKEESRIEEA